MKYRREIDGLRAVAVLPVIFFHAGFKAFEGGFVGVDVFFVISGYLITTIILSDMNKGKFSIVTFYERRARRILPALFFVMLCCVPFAWIWLSPSHLKDFSRSLTAVSAFSSNILFWKESGYFETAAELKPLLHTWSLSIEEQYYVLFPLFLMALWKLRKRWIFGSLMVVAVVSLIVSQWGAYNHPAATFFLLPTRGWELAVGALIAFFFLYKKEQSEFITSHKAISEVLGLLGLVLICYSIFAFSKATPFPSFYALIPTFGTALIIIFSTSDTIAGRLLSTKVMVGVGLLSYSTYLWHQPLFVFARHKSIAEPSVTLLLVLSILSIVLAYFSWRYVEMPFRDKTVMTRKKVFGFALVGSIVFAVTGIAGHIENGFEDRFAKEQLNVLAFNNYDKDEIYRLGTCFLKQEQNFKDFSPNCYDTNSVNSVMILGDSHAAALSYGLRETLDNVMQITSSACPPIFGLDVSNRKECKSINVFAEETIVKYKPKYIFLHANWYSYRYKNSLFDDRQLADEVKSTLHRISSASPDSKIIVIGGVPRWPDGLPNLLFRQRIELDGVLSLLLDDDSYNSLISIDKVLSNSVDEYGASFVSPINLLCNGNSCPAIIKGIDDYTLTAWDYGHLTAAGSTLLANKIVQHVEATTNKSVQYSEVKDGLF